METYTPGAECADPRPLLVTARMGGPLTYYGDGLHLDGPLSYGAYQEWLDDHDPAEMPPIGGPTVVDFAMPLATWRSTYIGEVHPSILDHGGQVWGWCCSAAQAAWVLPRKREVRKRSALDEMVRWTAAPSENYASGPRKSKDLAFPTVFSPTIRWYAYGDPARVHQLLERVHHIGKLSHHGSGPVLSWEVAEVEADLSVWRGTTLMRRLPATEALLLGRSATYRGVRAPYHHPSREVLCCEPDDDTAS